MLSHELKQIRLKLHLSQKEMAQKLGLSPQSICQLETGRYNITKTIALLAGYISKEQPKAVEFTERTTEKGLYAIQRYTDEEFLFEGEFISFRECVIAALKAGVDMSYVNLAHANLCGVNFGSANLTGVNFKNADLRGADITCANTHKASFHGAKFYNVDMKHIKTHSGFNGIKLTNRKPGRKLEKTDTCDLV